MFVTAIKLTGHKKEQQVTNEREVYIQISDENKRKSLKRCCEMVSTSESAVG
jgi:hypothetical protein